MNIVIEKLDWDSEFFGFDVGRINWKSTDDVEWQKILSLMRGYELCYVFADKAFSTFRKGVFHSTRTYYEKTLKELEVKVPKHQSVFKLLKPNHEAESIAVLAGEYSRFKKDDKMPSDALKKMYCIWLNQCFNNSNENQCWVYKHNQEFIGLICCQYAQKKAHVSLLAVKEAHRNKGVGSALLRHVENEAIKRSVQNISISSQGANEKANELYLKIGYKLKAFTHIYHLWKPNA